MIKASKNIRLEKPLDFAHTVLDRYLSPGDVTIDCTAGRGHDTLLLCNLVGASGHVFTIDVQAEAIQSTRDLIHSHNFGQRVTFIEEDHRHLEELIPEVYHGRIAGICFNLGYLPRSNKEVITTAQSTLAALDASTKVLADGGVITIVMYSGHPGGVEEVGSVLNWAQSLNQEFFTVFDYRIVNQKNSPPSLVVVCKLKN